MKIAMISQPMNGFSDEEVKKTKDHATQYLNSIGYEVINTFFEDECEGVKHIPVKLLAKSIEAMSHCDAVYFCDGWENARACRIEHDIARTYGLDTFHDGKDVITE